MRKLTALAPRSERSTFVIPSLDGIRALAVGVVFFDHLGIGASPGQLGVTVFFFLSGFLITTLLRMEYDRARRISFKAFYLRRVLRLFPPLYIFLTVACVVTALGFFAGFHLTPSAVLQQYFYLSNHQVLQTGPDGPLTGRPPGTEVLWSLAVEEHFYLLFPLLYVLLRRFLPSARRQAAVLGGICVAVLVWRLSLMLGLNAVFNRTYMGTDTRIDSILFGCILAVWRNPVLDRAAYEGTSDSLWRRYWAQVAVPVCLVVLLATAAISYSTHPKIAGTVVWTVQGLALMPLFAAVILYPAWGLVSLLNLRVVRYIGALSYSIYIVHWTVIDGLRPRLSGPHLFKILVYVVVTLALAMAMHHFIELPCARLRRRLSRIGVARGEGADEALTRAAPAHVGSHEIGAPAPAVPVVAAMATADAD